MLEDNLVEASNAIALAAISPAPIKSGSIYNWYQLLAHAGNNAIQHLAEAAEGVEVTDKNKVPPTNECEVYILSKAYRIVSRSPFKAETSDKPFYRIIYDLIQLTTVLNKDQWVSYIVYAETDFQMVFTHRHKDAAPGILRKVIKIIEVRFNGKVVFIRSDRETLLG